MFSMSHILVINCVFGFSLEPWNPRTLESYL